MESYEKNLIKEKAKWVRKTVLKMIYLAGSGHPGGSLSEVEILCTLYYDILNIYPNKPNDKNRDRFVLSKGHCCPSLYAILADKGYFQIEHLKTLRKFKSILQGHPSIVTPGIDSVSGSLGNGLSVGAGMAIAGKKEKRSFKVYVLLGDGELQEGSNWEAAMFAAHHKLDNLVAIVDYNKLQINGFVSNIIRIDPLADKWKAFGWNVIEVNGHDIEQLDSAFKKTFNNNKPIVIIAHTIKGKGVSYMENNFKWHGGAPDSLQMEVAMKELEDILYE